MLKLVVIHPNSIILPMLLNFSVLKGDIQLNALYTKYMYIALYIKIQDAFKTI